MKRYRIIAVIFFLLPLIFISCLLYGDTIFPFPARNNPESIDEAGTLLEISSNIDPVEDQAVIPLKPRIGIYSGTGSWDINVTAIENFLNEYNYQWSNFEETDITIIHLDEHYDLLWFPGGFAAEYKYYLGEHEIIRSFVEGGGLFVGSCAGAYYAADILRWSGTAHQYPLKLFDGEAVGPLSGLINWGEKAELKLDSDHQANHGQPPIIKTYYLDGPYFEPYQDRDHSSVILASYEINGRPAIIAGKYGQGKYLLFGPHPELGGYSSESPAFNLDGQEGAQWPWLNSLFTWFYKW